MRKEKKNLKGGWLPQILCGLMMSFTLFLFGPVDMYLSNASDFWFHLNHLLPLVIVPFVVCFIAFELVFILIRCVCPRIVYMLLLAMTFGASLMLYIQGNWLCLSNQMLSGIEPEWDIMFFEMLPNLMIWCAVIAASVLFVAVRPKLFMKAVAMVCTLVLVMEGVSLGVNLISYASENNAIAGEAYVTVEDAYTVSENGDVIVFMVDTLDTRIMDGILEEYPDCLTELDGFTYYRNTGGAFSMTEASIVAMLTGEICKNEEPFFSFANKAFSENELFTMLKENGFDLNVYGTPEFLFGEDMIGVIENLDRRNARVDNPLKFMWNIEQMVGYRYMPLFAQPFLYDDYAQLLYKYQGYKGEAMTAAPVDDAKLYSGLKEMGLSTDNDRRFFKFYRMWGAHRGYSLDREGRRVKGGSVTETDQVLGVFRIIGDYLKELKDKGLYDSSTVIILADHGYNNTPDCNNPTMMVKYPNAEKGSGITLSMAPTSHLDLRATIAYGAGIENYADLGTPVHEWEGVAYRERYHYDYEWKRPVGDGFYLGSITEYAVPADATDLAAYQPTGNVYEKP